MRALLVGLGVLLCQPAEAESRRGDEETVTSSSTLFQVRISEGDESTGAAAQAHMTTPTGEVYFSLLNPVHPLEAVLFNDGTLLTADDVSGMGRGVTLALYEPNGTCRWSHTITSMFDAEALAEMPQNGTLYWWRETPLEWRRENNALMIAMNSEEWVRVRMDDGAVDVITTSFASADPEMLVVRAHAASARDARNLYSSALAKDPTQIGGWLGLAELLQESGQHVAAINVLDQALSTNQLPAPGSPERELYVQIFLEQANSQTELGGLASSEGVLSRAIEIAPDNETALLALAALMLEGNRGPETDAMLEEWITRGDTLERSIVIGDFYAESGVWLSARKTYQQVWRLTRDVMMGSRLVEAHRMLGEFDEAISVRKQQIRRWQKMGGHEEFIAMAVEDVEQLNIAKGYQ